MEWGDPITKPAPGAGAGLKTGPHPKGSGIFAIDLDSPEAARAFDDLGGAGDSPVIMRTGRGFQLWYKHPGFWVPTTSKLWGIEGLDIRGDTGFVVAPGSPHKNGQTYRMVSEPEVLPEAPEWLLERLRAIPEPAEPQGHVSDVTDPQELAKRREYYATWLANEAPARGDDRRGDGDRTLYEVVQRGAYDLALPTKDVLELIEAHYDPRCDPPWGEELEERVTYKSEYAKTKSNRPRLDLVQSEIEKEAWSDLLDLGRHEMPRESGEDPFAIKWGGWATVPVPPCYLVEGLLVESKVTMIYSEPGSIKTWTALSIAESVASGNPWLGERGVRQGPVLFLDYEDGEHETHRRIHLLTDGQDREHLGYLYSPGRLDEVDFWKRLGRIVEEHGVVLVVIDTLAGGTPGTDENDRNAAFPLQLAGPFTTKTKATVLVLHHANKSGDFRGTSAFKANVDTLFKLETLEADQERHRAKLTCVKSGQKKVLPIVLELTDSGMARAERNEVEPEKPKERTYEELRAEILLAIESRGPFASKEAIQEVVKAKAASVRAVVADLEGSGHISKLPEGWTRDSDSLRLERLRTAIEADPEATRGRLLALAHVTAEFFDRQTELGCVTRRSRDAAIPGFCIQ